MPHLARLWLRAATVYFALACLFGLIIGIAQKFELATVHAHINLLGWVSMALIGILHAVVPDLRTAKSDLSFWVYQLSFPAFMISMFGTLLHNPVAEIAIRITATLMVVSVIWIAATVYRAVGKDA